jgi:hypothetical protein
LDQTFGFLVWMPWQYVKVLTKIVGMDVTKHKDSVIGVARVFTSHVLSVLLSAVLAVEAAVSPPPDGGASPLVYGASGSGTDTSIEGHPITHAVIFKIHLAVRKVIAAHQPFIGSIMLSPADSSLQDAFNIKRPQMLADRLKKFLSQS